MSTTTLSARHGAVDPAMRRPPTSRLIGVELRKAVDTRAGFWLLVVAGLLTVVTVVLRLTLGQQQEHTLTGAFEIAQLPLGVLVPVIGVLLMTSEWSQRTALTTFGLVPQRGRVVTAKLMALIGLALAATVVGLLATLAGFGLTDLFGSTRGGWSLSFTTIWYAGLFQVLNILMGAAFGLLLTNSAGAIVIYFALPTAWAIVGGLVAALRSAAQWLDTSRTMGPLTEPVAMTARQWEQLGVSVAVWILLPMLVGIWLLRRREVA
jgi:ABC-type transport system involved in multi-copper enzyme maturation permease subunit